MTIYSQTTTGFIESLATYLEGKSALSLTKGTNLFEEVIHETDQVGDHVSLFDGGYNDEGARHLRLRWSVRIAAVRDRRDVAIEYLRGLVDTLIRDRVFLITGFQVLSVGTAEAPVFVSTLENGRSLAAATLELVVIPST